MCQLHGGDVPCLFMGDLNLTSDSALYKFIATGQLDCAANDPRTLSGQQESRSGQRPYTPSPSNTPLPHTSPVCLRDSLPNSAHGTMHAHTAVMRPKHPTSNSLIILLSLIKAAR